MNNQDYTSTILVDATPQQAFNAIKDFRASWSEEIEGPTDQLDRAFFYHYKDIHLCKMKLIECIADTRLVYQVLENEFNFISDRTEWLDTQLVFDIAGEADKTRVTFTRVGLVPECECYPVCNEACTGYIQNSLYKLITSGKGEPNPKDRDGFNAELATKWQLG